MLKGSVTFPREQGEAVARPGPEFRSVYSPARAETPVIHLFSHCFFRSHRNEYILVFGLKEFLVKDTDTYTCHENLGLVKIQGEFAPAAGSTEKDFILLAGGVLRGFKKEVVFEQNL